MGGIPYAAALALYAPGGQPKQAKDEINDNPYLEPIGREETAPGVHGFIFPAWPQYRQPMAGAWDIWRDGQRLKGGPFLFDALQREGEAIKADAGRDPDKVAAIFIIGRAIRHALARRPAARDLMAAAYQQATDKTELTIAMELAALLPVADELEAGRGRLAPAWRKMAAAISDFLANAKADSGHFWRDLNQVTRDELETGYRHQVRIVADMLADGAAPAEIYGDRENPWYSVRRWRCQALAPAARRGREGMAPALSPFVTGPAIQLTGAALNKGAGGAVGAAGTAGAAGAIAREITQTAAARLAGVTARTIRKWEHGIGTPPDFPGLSSKAVYAIWANRYINGKAGKQAANRELAKQQKAEAMSGGGR